MQMTLPDDFIAEIVKRTVAETLAQRADTEGRLGGRLAFSEPEAAALLGLKPHVLRDMRLAKRITAVRCGRSFRYSRAGLLRFLAGEGEG